MITRRIPRIGGPLPEAISLCFRGQSVAQENALTVDSRGGRYSMGSLVRGLDQFRAVVAFVKPARDQLGQGREGGFRLRAPGLEFEPGALLRS